jgi:hypothetical protein
MILSMYRSPASCFQDFIRSLLWQFPDTAEALLDQTEQGVKARWDV